MTIIKPKRTTTPGNVPTTTDITNGEIAINLADNKLYVRDTGTNILTLSEPVIPAVENASSIDFTGQLSVDTTGVPLALDTDTNDNQTSNLILSKTVANGTRRVIARWDINGNQLANINARNSGATDADKQLTLAILSDDGLTAYNSLIVDTGGISVNGDIASTGDISATLNISAATLDTTGEATLASATVSDLTENRLTLAGVAGSLTDTANLEYSSDTLNITNSAVRMTSLNTSLDPVLSISNDMAGVGGGAQNSVATFNVDKNATNTTRRVWQTFSTTSGATVKYLASIDARDNSNTSKRLRFGLLEDDGLSSAPVTVLEMTYDGAEKTLNVEDSKFQIRGASFNNVFQVSSVDGQITQTVDGTTAPNSMNMQTTLPVTDTLHNFITSINDYGANTQPDGNRLTHTFKSFGASGERFVGRLQYTYDSTEADQVASLVVNDHAGSTATNSLDVRGDRTRTTQPMVFPGFDLTTYTGATETGMVLWDTNAGKLSVYNGTAWEALH